MAQPGNKDEPFFIIGCHRSGTSLMRELLRRHSRLFVPVEETTFLYKIFGNARRAQGVFGRRQVIELVSRLSVFTVEGQPILGFVRTTDLIEEMLSSHSGFKGLKDFIDALFSAMARRHGKVRWGDKSPMHTIFLDRLIRLWPRAPIIHLIRDGRDVIASLQNKMRRGLEPRESVITTAFHWKYYISCVQRFRAAHPQSSILNVHYEDLTRDPEGELKKVCAHLGESYEPEMLSLDYCNTAYPGGEGTGIRSPTRGKWRELFTEREQRLILAIIGRELQACGYLDRAPSVSLTPTERALIVREAMEFYTLMRARRMISRFGVLSRLRKAPISRTEIGPWDLK